LESFGNLRNVKFHWYAIEKSEVLSKNLKGIEQLLKAMKAKGKDARQSVTLTFSGYDHISDEVFEIMEIRQFVKILLHKHPYLFYYLAKDTECLQNIIMCYVDVETLFVGEKKAIAEYSLEDIMNNKLPQQNIFLNADSRTIQHWKKEITKYATKLNDLQGAVKVMDDLDSIFSK
jgi:hypothetical protein